MKIRNRILLAVFFIVVIITACAIITASATETENDYETLGYITEEEESTGLEELFNSDIINLPGFLDDVAELNGDDQFSPYIPPEDYLEGHVIEEGVYAFENVGNAGRWMDIEQGKYDPNYHMMQYATSGNPAQTFDRSCLFKITRRASTDTYIIRSMLNNRLTFCFSGNEVLTKEIPPNDADVDDSDTFKLIYNSATGSFTIQPYQSTNVVAANNTMASGTAGAPNSYLIKSTTTASGNQAKWKMYKYEGATKSGIVITASPALLNGDSLSIGQYTVFKIRTWTTEIGNNTPYLKLAPGYSSMASASWNASNYTLAVATMSVGTLKLQAIIRTDGTTTAFRTFAYYYSIVPNIDNEVGFIYNVGTSKYAQVAGASMSDGALIRQYAFSDVSSSRWLFELQDDGYFSIKSQYSSKYLGVNESATTSVGQYAALNDYTLWKFIETTSGNYKLVCKATESSGKVLAAEASIDGAKIIMTTYTNDDNYSDEWQPQRYIVFNNMRMNIGETSLADMEKLTASVTAEATDFTYSLACSHVASVVRLNSTTKEITANKVGVVLIKAYSSTYGTYFFKVQVFDGHIFMGLFSTEKGGTGHSWIQITNTTKSDIQVGHCTLATGDNITIGKYGIGGFAGVWYNKEKYEYNDDTNSMYRTSTSISTAISETTLMNINSFIISTYDTYALVGDNCADFAIAIWNLHPDNLILASDLDLILNCTIPAKLVIYIKNNFTNYQIDAVLSSPDFYGYYNGSQFVNKLAD